MSKLNIVVACGSGIATSTIAANKIEEILNEMKVTNYSISKTSMTNLKSHMDKADVVFTTNHYKGEHEIPVMSVVPFITGIKEELTKEKVASLLKDVLERKGE